MDSEAWNLCIRLHSFHRFPRILIDSHGLVPQNSSRTLGGFPWKVPHSWGKIPQDNVPILYSSAKINLNNTIKSCIEWDVITLRTYEVLACKGFLISDTVPAAKRTMQDCLVFTEGEEDLTEKIKYYLAHSKKREEIAQNGYDYVVKNCSIDARSVELMNHILEVVK